MSDAISALATALAIVGVVASLATCTTMTNKYDHEERMVKLQAYKP